MSGFKIKQSNTSPSFSLDNNDLNKLIKDAGIVAAGAFIAYLMAHISDVNFGSNTFIIIPAISMLLNMIYKWIQNNSPENRGTLDFTPDTDDEQKG